MRERLESIKYAGQQQPTNRHPTLVYRSAVDGWFFPTLFMAPLVVSTVLTYLTSHSWSGVLIGAGIGLLTLVVIRPLALPCYYTLENECLRVKSGFLEIVIPFEKIRKVERVRSYWAAPCLSVNRVLITTIDGKEMVSPEDRAGFIADISYRI